VAKTASTLESFTLAAGMFHPGKRTYRRNT